MSPYFYINKICGDRVALPLLTEVILKTNNLLPWILSKLMPEFEAGHGGMPVK